MIRNPSVSVITPSFNSQDYIENTIRSVVDQSITDWELFIIDDCSSDSSVELIKKWVIADSRIHLVELNENSGAAVARNKGIELAKGRYIAFLDSDDTWLPKKLEWQLDFMEQLMEIKVVPEVGPAYYLVPADGGGWIREDETSLLIPSWVLFRW